MSRLLRNPAVLQIKIGVLRVAIKVYFSQKYNFISNSVQNLCVFLLLLPVLVITVATHGFFFFVTNGFADFKKFPFMWTPQKSHKYKVSKRESGLFTPTVCKQPSHDEEKMLFLNRVIRYQLTLCFFLNISLASSCL